MTYCSLRSTIDHTGGDGFGYNGQHGKPRFDTEFFLLSFIAVTRVTKAAMRILVVTNQKGGVGKTTTAISLGAALVARGQRVLIVDLDPQANATSGVGVRKDLPNGIYGVLLKEQPISSAIVQTGLPGLDLIPSSAEMSGAEVELVPLLAGGSRWRQAMRGAGDYETVIIDCPPSLGLLTVNALVAGDGVVVPVQCEYYALEGLAQLLETIEAVRQRLNERLEVLAIVLTMEDRRNRLSMQVADEVRRHFPKLVARTRIPRSVRLAEAPSHGKPISIYDPSSRGAQSYAELAREIDHRLKSREAIPLSGAIA